MKKPSPLPPEVAAQFRDWAAKGNTPHHQVCAHCGSSYVAKKRWSVYCRDSCRKAARRQSLRTQKETS